MAATPQFASVPVIGIGQIATANANRDGTGTVGTVLTAGTDGTRIDSVVVTATGTTTAGMIRLFLHDGSVYRLFKEQAVTAITPSATVAAFTASITLGIVLPTGWSLRASTEKAETFNVAAFGGNL